MQVKCDYMGFKYLEFRYVALFLLVCCMLPIAKVILKWLSDLFLRRGMQGFYVFKLLFRGPDPYGTQRPVTAGTGVPGCGPWGLGSSLS